MPHGAAPVTLLVRSGESGRSDRRGGFREAGLERRGIVGIVPMVTAALLGVLVAVAGLPLGWYGGLACAALQAGCPATAPPAGNLPGPPG